MKYVEWFGDYFGLDDFGWDRHAKPDDRILKLSAWKWVKFMIWYSFSVLGLRLRIINLWAGGGGFISSKNFFTRVGWNLHQHHITPLPSSPKN